MSELTDLYFVESVSGNVTTPANAIGAPDNVWTTDDLQTNWSHRWRLDTVLGNNLPVGDQVLTLRLRKSNSRDCTVSSVVLIQGLAGGATSTSTIRSTAFTVTSVLGENLTVSFPSSVLDGTLEDVVIELNTLGSTGGAGGDRSAVQIDGATWTASYEILGLTANEIAPPAIIDPKQIIQSHITLSVASSTVTPSINSIYALMTQPTENEGIGASSSITTPLVVQMHLLQNEDMAHGVDFPTLGIESTALLHTLDIETSTKLQFTLYQYTDTAPAHENFNISTIANLTFEMFDEPYKYKTKHQPGSFISFFKPQ